MRIRIRNPAPSTHSCSCPGSSLALVLPSSSLIPVHAQAVHLSSSCLGSSHIPGLAQAVHSFQSLPRQFTDLCSLAFHSFLSLLRRSLIPLFFLGQFHFTLYCPLVGKSANGLPMQIILSCSFSGSSLIPLLAHQFTRLVIV